ncbi:MAG: hypothetical protein Kow0010_17420 [Dehalococcoidia bacterium]
MAIARGLLGAFGIFAASFALHIVGGATDQGWLFAAAVGLVYVSAAGFPAFAMLFSGAAPGSFGRRAAFVAGIPAGVALTASALWAANDRTLAWLHALLAPALVAGTTGVVLAGLAWLPRPGWRREARTSG